MLSVDDRRREIEFDPELLEGDGDCGNAVAWCAGHRDRELATGMETGRLPRRRGQVRLGKNGDQPFRGQSVDRRIDRSCAATEGQKQFIRRGDLATRKRVLRKKLGS